MHDIKAIRAAPEAFDAAMARRGFAAESPEIVRLDAARRAAMTAQQEAQSRRNALAKEIGAAKRTGADTAALEAEATQLRGDMERLAREADGLDAELSASLARLPNVLADEVPEGRDESFNLELKRWGTLRNFAFEPKQHFELGEALGMMDFERAAKIAGARFTVLRGALARLERALGQFMLNLHTE